MSKSLTICLSLLALTLIVGVLLHLKSRLKSEREAFIRGYPFPIHLRQKLLMRYPHWEGEQMQLALRALRQYFLVCLEAGAAGGGKAIGMPSKAVDEAWHEFILMSRHYTEFCRHAFGRYLHHNPESMLRRGIDDALVNTLHQLRTKPGGTTGWSTWSGIPLLFAADRALGVTDGYFYDTGAMSRLEHKRQLKQLKSEGSDWAIENHDTSSWFGFDPDGVNVGGGWSSCGGGGGDGGGCGGGCSS